MDFEHIIFELSVIMVGSAILGTLFLYAKQPVIIAYIAIGVVVGPHGFSLLKNTETIEQISHLGVVLLLFLIGLNLQPGKLIRLFRATSPLTLGTSLFFGGAAFGFGRLLGFETSGALVFGAAMMFSSTVIGLKLIPTTTLHHRRTGEIMTSILLLQDMLAVLVILFISGDKNDAMLVQFFELEFKFLLLCVVAFVGVRFVMIPLLTKFYVVQEYSFLVTLGWCLLWAETAHLIGLSYEIGAFVAGLSIASCKIALVIAEHLKPLREFFLILFFFSVGSKLDLRLDPRLLIPAVAFGMLLVPLKAGVFRLAFRLRGEKLELQKELAVRLSQSSEFSLLVVFSAVSAGLLSEESAMVVQVSTIATFVVSTYWVVRKYPTPITSSPLNKD
jgi:Kef-type K+ transport system membrane component KefB